MVAVPSAISLLLLAFPASRATGKRVLFGSTGAAIGLILYQLAYILFCIVVVLSCALVGMFLGDSVIALVLILVFYVFWFIALLFGYVSGFRVGLRYASGEQIVDCLRKDW